MRNGTAEIGAELFNVRLHRLVGRLFATSPGPGGQCFGIFCLVECCAETRSQMTCQPPNLLARSLAPRSNKDGPGEILVLGSNPFDAK
jgi:hypothetical protein